MNYDSEAGLLHQFNRWTRKSIWKFPKKRGFASKMVSIKVLPIILGVITLWGVVGAYFYVNSARDQLSTSPVVSYSATCTETNQYDECIAYGSITTIAPSSTTVLTSSKTTKGMTVLQKTTVFSDPVA